jgi:UDP-N-acetylglucosamine--N-acetylmuramyl-(pentapeptide) pyrophosphoryl-undecaprenol N-acetylglucosamine transferase
MDRSGDRFRTTMARARASLGRQREVPASATSATVLVASGGGHLAELHALHSRLVAPDERAIWVTEDCRQARSLLAGAHVLYTPAVSPRDYRNVAENVAWAWRLLREQHVGRVISTGAGIALAYLPLARAIGVPAHFIESAARLEGPSVTGRALATMPGVVTYTQAARWASRGWAFRGSVFDGFTPAAAAPGGDRCPPPVRKVVVTVGTMAFPFDRLVRRVGAVLPRDAEVTWQVGASTVVPAPPGGRGTAQRQLPWRELQARIREADVVIAHAGVGSALEALMAGKLPILIPRRARHGEHVDDHQAQIAAELAGRRLAVTCEADELQPDHLLAAAGASVTRLRLPPPFRLRGEDRPGRRRTERPLQPVGVGASPSS